MPSLLSRPRQLSTSFPRFSCPPARASPGPVPSLSHHGRVAAPAVSGLELMPPSRRGQTAACPRHSTHHYNHLVITTGSASRTYTRTIIHCKSDYRTMDTESVLLASFGIDVHPCRTGQYRVWGGEKKKQKDSLVDLAMAIIDPYYKDIKAECHKDKTAWQEAWVNELDEEHIKYVTKDAYSSYEMYRRIIDMRKCLLPADGEV